MSNSSNVAIEDVIAPESDVIVNSGNYSETAEADAKNAPEEGLDTVLINEQTDKLEDDQHEDFETPPNSDPALSHSDIGEWHSVVGSATGSAHGSKVGSHITDISKGSGDKDGIKRGRTTRRDKNLIGLISLSMKYIYKTTKLQIEIKQCWDIIPKDKNLQRVDPYVKVYLLPDKSKVGKRKSQIVRDTFHPTFNKKLEYEIPKAELENRTLYVSLWHNILFGKNQFLAEASVAINVDFPGAKTYQLRTKQNLWGEDSSDEDSDDDESKPADDTMSVAQSVFSMSSKTSHKSGKSMSKSAMMKQANFQREMAMVMYSGDILVAIKFVPENDVTVIWDRDLESRGECHVQIKKGMNLTGFGENGETNAYCKFVVRQHGKVLQKHKTRIIKNNSNPEWNSRKRFENVGKEDLRDTELVFTVWNKIGMANKLIGRAKITITGIQYDWTRAKCLSDNTMYLDEVIDQANNWIEFVAPLTVDNDDKLS